MTILLRVGCYYVTVITEGWLLLCYCAFWLLSDTRNIEIMRGRHRCMWAASVQCRDFWQSQPPPARGVSQSQSSAFPTPLIDLNFYFLYAYCYQPITKFLYFKQIPICSLIGQQEGHHKRSLYNLLIFKSITNTTVFISYFAKEVIKSSAPQKCNKLRL